MLNWLFSKPLAVGTPAPDFTLSDDAGNAYTLSALRGRAVVLVFYPSDNTPVCTRQLCEFRDAWESLRRRGVEVFGINPGSAERHAGFRAKRRLPFPLLVDERQQVASLYNADAPIIVRRTVYRIDPDGTIAFARRGTPSPEEVMGRG